MHRFVKSLGAALSIASVSSTSITKDEQQVPLTATDGTRLLDPWIYVPGTNNATYGPVPEADQLFEIEFLEIAPSPFRV
jgi:hypothetical protein